MTGITGRRLFAAFAGAVFLAAGVLFVPWAELLAALTPGPRPYMAPSPVLTWGPALTVAVPLAAACVAFGVLRGQVQGLAGQLDALNGRLEAMDGRLRAVETGLAEVRVLVGRDRPKRRSP